MKTEIFCASEALSADPAVPVWNVYNTGSGGLLKREHISIVFLALALEAARQKENVIYKHTVMQLSF